MTEVSLTDLRLGGLLAEGGEGRVFEVVRVPVTGDWLPDNGDAPAWVYKQLRRPRPIAELKAVVEFPLVLAAGNPGLASRIRSSSAWPSAAVVGDDPSWALGTLMPRAPVRFWLKHREGAARPATLSYLAGDPDRIAVAYGAHVPAPGSPERVALVYALCRLVASWQAAGAPVQAVHGDLSAKNVLWSLAPTPAVYVLDCDGAAVGAPATRGDAPAPIDGADEPRLRATTPNWDDPALPRGAVPTEWSDRYTLGLAFLRVLGAANFPLQARQRSLEKLNVDLELPRSWRRLPDMPALWELCERALSLAGALDRPSPDEWSAQLEALLDVLGAADLGARVRAAQGDSSSGGRPAARAPMVTVPDVVVRPILRQRTASTWQLISPRPTLADAGERPAGPGLAAGPNPREIFRRTTSAWAGAHRLALLLVRSPGRRGHGLRRLVGALALDVAAACVVLFLVGMAVSPWIGL